MTPDIDLLAGPHRPKYSSGKKFYADFGDEKCDFFDFFQNIAILGRTRPQSGCPQRGLLGRVAKNNIIFPIQICTIKKNNLKNDDLFSKLTILTDKR